MMRGRFQWLALVGILVLTASSGGQAHEPKRLHFSGLIEDVTVPSAGAWVIHGTWSLDAKEDRNGVFSTADFTATLTMERSDYWLVSNPAANPENLAIRNAHTHHIAVSDAAVTSIPGGFRVAGPATITANGAAPPFGTSCCTVQIDITGGTIVALSNLKLTFEGNAVSHFGSQPLAGVVRRSK